MKLYSKSISWLVVKPDLSFSISEKLSIGIIELYRKNVPVSKYYPTIFERPHHIEKENTFAVKEKCTRTPTQSLYYNHTLNQCHQDVQITRSIHIKRLSCLLILIYCLYYFHFAIWIFIYTFVVETRYFH